MLALRRNDETGIWDLVPSEDGEGYSLDYGLWTLAAITLGTEAPDPSKTGFDKSGTWSDSLDESLHKMGCRIWTLYGEVLTLDTQRKAELYLREAFQFWIDDGICSRIEVEVEVDDENERLLYQVSAFQGDDAAPLWVGHWGHTLNDPNGLTQLEPPS